MLISKLALIAGLGLTAAAYPAGRPEDTTSDASMSLRPVGNSPPSSTYDGPLQAGQRRPKSHHSKRDDLHPTQGPTTVPQRVGSGRNHLLPGTNNLLPGINHLLPGTNQPAKTESSRQYSKRHEGHDSEPPQAPPSSPNQGPPSKPDRTGPSQGNQSDSSERPDRNQAGRTKGEHGHDHLRDHNKPGKEGKEGKDRPSGRPSKPDDAASTSKHSSTAAPTPMPSKSAESVASSELTPTASLRPGTSAGPAY